MQARVPSLVQPQQAKRYIRNLIIGLPRLFVNRP